MGAGALASGLARSLHAEGFEIAEIVARSSAQSQLRAAVLARAVKASVASLNDARIDCDVLWLAVPDEAVEAVAEELAGRSRLPRVVLHASGALSSRALGSLAARGAETGSAHPMMTFVAGKPPSLQGVWFAVEGSTPAVKAARALARALGARSFSIDAEKKALYHAFGAMLSPMLAAEMTAAERLGVQAGISKKDVRRIMEPIVKRTVENVLGRGAEKSFSGPLARGDVRTIAAHLAALGNLDEAKVYRALATYAIEALPVKRGSEIKKLLMRKAR